jgi:hypothetical protein
LVVGHTRPIISKPNNHRIVVLLNRDSDFWNVLSLWKIAFWRTFRKTVSRSSSARP